MLKSKTPEIMLPALEQAFVNLGGTPRVLVSDSEGALLSNELNKCYKKNNIQQYHITEPCRQQRKGWCAH
jgi:hypothetical protein